MKMRSLCGLLTASGVPFCLFALALQATSLSGCVAAGGEPGDEPGGRDEAGESESAALTASAVTEHGALKIVGNQLQDKNGAQVQLKGMSLFWSQWSGSFWNASVVNSLADDWHATVVRAAMGIESGGYLDNPTAEKTRVKTIVDAAIAKGIYVIIDWHDHNASQHTAQSKAFFTEMAQTYGKQPNVIFEIFNEPDYESWTEVKTYAEDVIGAIRAAGSNNVVVVGTPTWSQDVDVAASNPITKFTNVAYTLHFYAGTHRQFLRDKATTALNKGLALFVTEFGTCDASGNGGLDLTESQTWIDFLNQRKISFANWSLFDKPETASALVPGASTTGGWADAQLTASGKFAKQKIGEATSGGTTPPPPPPPPPPTGSFSFTVSPNINPYWIQVKVAETGHTIQSVTATVSTGAVYNLQLQSWGEWTISPPSAVPAGSQVIFKAKDETGAVGTFTSQPWPG